jgi:signal transduction histidine kinase
MTTQIDEGDQLALPIRETLFRITQEALANIARHSGASSVDIRLENGLNHVTLAVKDNGRGFDLQAKHNGLGLHSMQERAQALGGTLQVESEPGKGTQVRASLPKNT